MRRKLSLYGVLIALLVNTLLAGCYMPPPSGVVVYPPAVGVRVYAPPPIWYGPYPMRPVPRYYSPPLRHSRPYYRPCPRYHR